MKQTYSSQFDARFLTPEDDKRSYFAEFISYLNEHFTTQEEMELRLPILALDFAAKNGFNLTVENKPNKDVLIFTKL